MKNVLDLRFVIGLFFLLVGIFLFVTSIVSHPEGGKTETVNLWCGVVYVAFAVLMLTLWKVGGNKEPIEMEEE